MDNQALAPATSSDGSESPAQIAFGHSIWYLLTSWPPMNLALAEQWAGEQTSDKRDWLAGYISDVFVEQPDVDAEYIEDILLQVMGDEFDCEVQDESQQVVAREIIRMRNEIMIEGRLEAAEEVKRTFLEKRGRTARIQNAGEREEEVDSDEEIEIDGDGDDNMGEAPALVPVREKVEPEVDEDGFTKVVSKKRR